MGVKIRRRKKQSSHLRQKADSVCTPAVTSQLTLGCDNAGLLISRPAHKLSTLSTSGASQSHFQRPSQAVWGYSTFQCAQKRSSCCSTAQGNGRPSAVLEPEATREVNFAGGFKAVTLVANCLKTMSSMANGFNLPRALMNDFKTNTKLTSTCFKAVTLSTRRIKTTLTFEKSGTERIRMWRTCSSGRRGKSVLLVAFLLCLAQHVSDVSGNPMTGSLFSMGHSGMMLGHGLSSSFSDNSSVSCPGSCVCTDGGFRVDCSGQNLTQVPKEIPSGTTHL